MDYKDIANRLRKWANGETCEDCPAKDDLAFCAADAIYDLLSRVEAIRPVSREQVEKVWRGEWVHKRSPYDYKIYVCKNCRKQISIQGGPLIFCPSCGAPMTDEAVDMMMERINKMEEMEMLEGLE